MCVRVSAGGSGKRCGQRVRARSGAARWPLDGSCSSSVRSEALPGRSHRPAVRVGDTHRHLLPRFLARSRIVHCFCPDNDEDVSFIVRNFSIFFFTVETNQQRNIIRNCFQNAPPIKKTEECEKARSNLAPAVLALIVRDCYWRNRC